MDWINTLLSDSASVAHVVFLYSFVIASGVLLGKIKVFGVSLGVTFVLFMGILVGHFGMTASENILDFIRDFGLILFVYCIGLQVGPSFFSSFKKDGISMNIVATLLVVLNVVVALILCYTAGGGDVRMFVGMLFGATTNTPGLGAATEALHLVGKANTGEPISLAYACAYPLGVVGIILSTIALRYICRVDLKQEEEDLDSDADIQHAKPFIYHLEVHNESLVGKTLGQVRAFLNRPFVCSRICRKADGEVSIPDNTTVLQLGDQLFITSSEEDVDAITAFIGIRVEVDWEHQKQEQPMISRRIIVTKSEINGKRVADMHFRSLYGVSVTRVNRAGVDLFARPNLVLQVGDRVTVVGYADAVGRVADHLGNSMARLNHPNIVTIFVGILLGVLLGSVPFPSGMATPLKLGIAGGPLIVAILIGAFGYKLKLVTYTTASANLMVREIGITLFLASVGIKAGPEFLNTVVHGNGLTYVWCGFLVTVIPILIAGIVARYVFKINYFTLMGLIAGANTDPPALAFSNASAGNGGPSVGYSTVYPLSMFLRILTGQMIVLILLG